jgi:hypothetical protein
MKCCAGNNGAADYCTASGLACVGGDTCTACGTPGLPCCPGNSCGNGGCCDHGNAALPTGVCMAPAAACSGGQGACTDGGCMGGLCGKPGQPACGSNVDCTAPLTIKSSGSCASCGGQGEPCCSGVGGAACEAPYACAGGTCQLCGGNGQPCCQGSQCYTSTNRQCSGGTCS